MCITSFGKICFHWVLFPRGKLGGAISNIFPHPFNPPCPTPLLPPRHADTYTVCSPLLSGLKLSSYHLVLFWVLYCIIVILSKKRLRTKSQKIQNSSSIYGGLFEFQFFMDRRRIPHSTVLCVCGGGECRKLKCHFTMKHAHLATNAKHGEKFVNFNTKWVTLSFKCTEITNKRQAHI